ncbi:MAG: hypothetical protein JWM80_4806 [Cyanobacteria bacterium RYN_339]|nr:hypothetical protein [Cyanobacteria bacterium RYN_339]
MNPFSLLGRSLASIVHLAGRREAGAVVGKEACEGVARQAGEVLGRDTVMTSEQVLVDRLVKQLDRETSSVPGNRAVMRYRGARSSLNTMLESGTLTRQQFQAVNDRLTTSAVERELGERAGMELPIRLRWLDLLKEESTMSPTLYAATRKRSQDAAAAELMAMKFPDWRTAKYTFDRFAAVADLSAEAKASMQQELLVKALADAEKQGRQLDLVVPGPDSGSIG